MVTILVLVIVIAGIVWFTMREGNKSATDSLTAAAKKVEAKVVAAADLNHDGKVNLEDAKVAVAEVKKVAEKAAEVEKKVVEKVKKTAGRKKKS